MMGMPIETTREGNAITKICVEDVDKIINRVRVTLNQSYSSILGIIHSIQKNYKGVNGKFIIGTGTSQPCLTDAFDEEIGNNIAFMKAKLNANIKKRNILRRIYKELIKVIEVLETEISKIDEYINLDIDGIRKHNPEYLIDKF